MIHDSRYTIHDSRLTIRDCVHDLDQVRTDGLTRLLSAPAWRLSRLLCGTHSRTMRQIVNREPCGIHDWMD